MSITLYNSLTRKKESFVPLTPGLVGMYVCGPTVYDYPHIGNARSVVIYDVLYRLLCHEYGSSNVTYVRNITDVDDKINIAAKAQNITIQELTSRVTDVFHDNISKLGCLKPNIEPRATEHIGEMIEITQVLITLGHAYESDQHVYFAVESDPAYGQMAAREIDEMIAGARVQVAKGKRHPGDFVLWKPADEQDDPSAVFDSPWGQGRPGWHIECSAMSSKYLGQDFDIHGGGADLMFPHHTNEIAQSCCAYPESHFARYWVHNGFLTVNGEKMSKSLGNFFTVQELLDKGISGMTLRYLLLSTHYRKPMDFNDKAISDAKKAVDGFARLVQDHAKLPGTIAPELLAVLQDDLNVPAALAVLHALAAQIHKTSDIAQKELLAGSLKACLELLGFELKQDARPEIDEMVCQQISVRNKARADKNWALSDQIRDSLKRQGIILEDKPDGSTIWHYE